MSRFAALLFLGFSSISHACDEPISESAERESSGAPTSWRWTRLSAIAGTCSFRDSAPGSIYRDANCELVAERPEGPAGDPYVQCVTFMTRERTLELRLICRTVGEGVDCDLTDLAP